MELNLLKHQAKFVTSQAPHTGLVAGYGSGKSYAGIVKAVLKKIQYDGIDVAYYLPTYPLIKDIAFKKFPELLNKHNIEYTLNKSDKDIHTPYGRIICRSMDNPDSIIGYETGYALIDEADVLPQKKMDGVFEKVIGRNRVNTPDGLNSTDMVSTPEGYKFLYDFFEKKPSENKRLIRARTVDNPFLPENYIQTLKEKYNEQQLQSYLNGEFVNLTSGSVYSDYDIKVNDTDREPKDGDSLHIGMDFNITNMSAVVHVYEDGTPKAIDEFSGYYDTNDICTAIRQRYGRTVTIYPDASGNSRNSSGHSDFNIIRSFGFKIVAPKQNPEVRERVNTMNYWFRNGYAVNRNKCPNYSDALVKLAYKNGKPDKSSGLDHITDAGGYFICNLKKSGKGYRSVVI
jgi:PBSX family phage terminase large subunit